VKREDDILAPLSREKTISDSACTYAGVEDLDVKREDDILTPPREPLAGQLIVGRVHVQHLQ
jgi:hypothetical protein